jgi:hypothetical protein
MMFSLVPIGGITQASTPVALFALPQLGFEYEPSNDGRRFLVYVVTEENSPITVLLNWTPASGRRPE